MCIRDRHPGARLVRQRGQPGGRLAHHRERLAQLGPGRRITRGPGLPELLDQRLQIARLLLLEPGRHGVPGQCRHRRALPGVGAREVAHRRLPGFAGPVAARVPGEVGRREERDARQDGLLHGVGQQRRRAARHRRFAARVRAEEDPARIPVVHRVVVHGDQGLLAQGGARPGQLLARDRARHHADARPGHLHPRVQRAGQGRPVGGGAVLVVLGRQQRQRGRPRVPGGQVRGQLVRDPVSYTHL